MYANDIRVKEKANQETKLQLEPCNKGNCPIIRSGKIHKNFHFSDKLKIQYTPLIILFSITVGLAIISAIIIDSDKDWAIKISLFISIPIGLVAIQLTRIFDKKGKKHDQWFSFKENAKNFYYNKDWEKGFSSATRALEIKYDLTMLTIISLCLLKLEKFSQAVIYFEKLLENDPQHVDGSNIINCYQKLGMYNEMIFYINQFLDVDVNANILNNIGRVCLDEYDFNGALYFFEQAIELESTEPIFWTNKGMAYNGLIKFEQSIECFNQALQLDHSNKNAIAHKSVALFGLEKYDEIISFLDTFFEIKPLHKQTVKDSNQLVLIQHLAVAFGKTGKFENALKHYNQYLTVVPNDKDSLRSKADTLSSLLRFNEALIIYEKYLKLEPYDPEALNNKMICLLESENYVRAMACANLIHRLFPRYNGLHYAFGLFFQHKSQHEDAQKYFRITLQDESKDLINMRYRALSFGNLGLYFDELETYQEMLSEKPNDVEIMMNLGLTYEKIQNYSEAINTYDKILKLIPQHQAALAHKGSSLTMIGNHSEAITVYNGFLEKNPNDSTILANKGVSLVGIRKYNRSLKYFERSLNINPISYVALYGKGQALIGLDKFDEALEVLDESLEINPNFYGSYLELGNAYSFLGDRKKGIENFHKSLEFRPKNPTTLYNLSQAYLQAHYYNGDIPNILNSIKYYIEFLRTGSLVPTSKRMTRLIYD